VQGNFNKTTFRSVTLKKVMNLKQLLSFTEMRFFFQRLLSCVRVLCNFAKSSVTDVRVGSFPTESTNRMFLAFCSYNVRHLCLLSFQGTEISSRLWYCHGTGKCSEIAFYIQDNEFLWFGNLLGSGTLRFCNLNLSTQYHHQWENGETTHIVTCSVCHATNKFTLSRM
jgi:hypothetical protein